MKKLITVSILFAATLLIQSCISTARLKDFPQSARTFDFNKIANSRTAEKDDIRDSKTGFEYYLKTNILDDSLILHSIIDGLNDEGFSIKFIDENNGAVLAKRGMRANEWNSVAGVYYQKINDGFEIYVNCKITQDFTGGWREDRAREIGEKICEFLKNCTTSYTVATETEE
ncbi:MAG: hypothetical protein V4642_08420 [Bacteroidota bacterium]